MIVPSVEVFCAGHFEKLNMLEQVLFRAEYEKTIANYRLDINGVHGIRHWQRVLQYGVRIAEHTGIHIYPVMLFALLHDSARASEGGDYGHGYRAAMPYSSVHHKFGLKDIVFTQLLLSISSHTEVWPENIEHMDLFANDGVMNGALMMCVCLDADRLDIGRIGVDVDEDRLFLEASKMMIDSCSEQTDREENEYYDQTG